MSSQNNLSQIKQIINEIQEKSADSSYIYRGEHKLHKEHPHNGKVSSSLWREYSFEEAHFDIETVQREMLRAAKEHIGHPAQGSRANPAQFSDWSRIFSDMNIDIEILTELQHYGGKTNLIDFTTDYFIAIFFACDGHPNEDGRVILLQKTNEIENIIMRPQSPRHRVIAQKSVFIRPLKGFIEPREEETVTIPASLKQPLLEYLRKYHDISTETIYNDLYGFIRNQNVHVRSYTHFYRGFACQNRINEALTPEEKQREYEEAIKHYTEAIKLKPDLGMAYNNRGIAYMHKGEFDNAIRNYTEAIRLNPDNAGVYGNRGEAWLHLQEWEKAKSDLITAKDMGSDIIASFHNDYESVADFEQKTGIQLPEDIAALLTPPQA